MTCEEALALMSAKLDDELSHEETEALAAHLKDCPDCRRWMEAMQAVDENVAALEEPAPEGLKKGVLYRIDQASGKAKKPVNRWFGPGTALGAAAAVLVLLVGLGVIPLRNRTAAPQAAPEQIAGKPVAPDSAPIAEQLKPASDAETNGWKNYYSAPTQIYAPTELPTHEDQEKSPLVPDNAVDEPSPSRNSSESDPNDNSAAERLACEKLSETEDAMVLLYTDFDADSLFDLLKVEEPALYELTEEMRTVEENGMLRYETDCGTVLAIQEWLVNNLPPAESIDAASISAERRMKSRMEALDPGSASLSRIITFSRIPHAISWPDSWPSDWADRLRTAESWELFFPSEDYTPNAEKPAMLVFASAE